MHFTIATLVSLFAVSAFAAPLDTSANLSPHGGSALIKRDLLGLEDATGSLAPIDVLDRSEVNAGLGVGVGVDLGLGLGLGLGGLGGGCGGDCNGGGHAPAPPAPPAPAKPTTTTVKPCPTPSPAPPTTIVIDINVWANALSVKLDAIIKLIDGQSSPVNAILHIIAEIDAAVKVIAAANVKLASNVDLGALVQVMVAIMGSLVVGISKCSAANIAVSVQVLAQLDACLKGLVLAIGAHLGGFIGACGQALVHVNLFAALHLDAVLRILLRA